MKNVTYPNLRHNLEAQSKRVFSGLRLQGEVVPPQGERNFAYDYTNNKRLEGSSTGINSFVSRSERHGQVDEVGSSALTWVKGRIAAPR